MPKLSVAFKFEQQTVLTIVTGHNWNVSKLNQLVPTITFEPVKLDGKNITEASGFNLAYIVAQNLFVNRPCQVRLANSVIPQVIGGASPQALDERATTLALKGIMPEFCPMCKSPVVFDQAALVFRCSTFRCQQLIFMQQAKKVFGLDNIGKVGLAKTYNTKGFNFQTWFVDLLRQRLAQQRTATV
jgi:NAD-dependent DNA ligase